MLLLVFSEQDKLVYYREALRNNEIMKANIDLQKEKLQ
ncbi:hypothetical protein Desde_1251 [Desulfitobacterium dehalogenans ATCC 51507]|uniref:Uncharacterized protein n=1 Tax=Desulfitobacterium dehalogenans (strain ATCC 51507 / DSM 9161 / JW/IU-DC1) TaxID=756499 RepID=I4A6U6_DESDJ|nr:hypothetical protein Desde_1251 [Desulfitobacterium dehalogenans ATCC 51507]